MIIKYDRVSFSICLSTAVFSPGKYHKRIHTERRYTKDTILCYHCACWYTETFYVVVEGQVVINAVEIIEALFLTCNQFYIFNIEYYKDNIASWQFIQHVIAENKYGKVLKKVITLTQKLQVRLYNNIMYLFNFNQLNFHIYECHCLMCLSVHTLLYHDVN